jgi:hypothetical protein
MVVARGFFPDAEVVRGHDWLWGDQDGKKSFKILSYVCHFSAGNCII